MRLPRWVRETLRPVASRVPVPIVSGTNRGRWWNLASAGSGYASGRRSREQMQVLESLIERGDCVWDVGAHHGYMTLSAARRVGPEGHVYAFEPGRTNHDVLRRHLRWNDARNTEALAIALGDFDGEAAFGGTGTSKMLALGAGDETVRVRRGDALVRAGICAAPMVMKVDVEGAEAAVLRGMGCCLPARARLLVAIHSAEAHTDCCAALASRDFEVMPSRGLLECLNGTWRGDPDLLALGPGCRDFEMPSVLREYLAA